MTGDDRLQLLVCQHFARELTAAVAACGYGDVDVVPYGAMCMHPQGGRMEAADQLLAMLGANGPRAVLVGACFMAGDVGRLGALPPERILLREQCFHLLVNRGIVDRAMGEGAYVLTPSWVEDWESHIEDWGFDRPTAKEFFHESTSRLLLLDTGVLPGADRHLQELGAFLELPVEILPVGLDHLTLELQPLVLRWRHERVLGNPGASDDASARRLADYSMAFELMSSLTRIMSEDEALSAVTGLFSMLFAARHVLYLPLDDGRPGDVVAADPDGGDRARVQTYPELLAGGKQYAVTPEGFCLRVAYDGQTLGILGIEGLAFPEHRRDYLNLALSVAGVCGLAVTNAQAVTRIRQAEAALRERTVELERSNADLGQFAYVASHDLQEPLRTVTGFVELLQMRYGDKLDDRANLYIGQAVGGARRMSRLITDLLQYSRVGTHGAPLVPTSTQTAFEAARANLAAAADEAGATITADALPDVLGDEGQLTQVLQNLMGNALKFRGERAPEVHVAASETDTGWRLTVQDNGIGIDMEYAGQVFEVFKRLHGVGDYEGSGVGLAVCRRVIERHGGEIWVESTPGEGASFHFTLQSPPDPGD